MVKHATDSYARALRRRRNLVLRVVRIVDSASIDDASAEMELHRVDVDMKEEEESLDALDIAERAGKVLSVTRDKKRAGYGSKKRTTFLIQVALVVLRTLALPLRQVAAESASYTDGLISSIAGSAQGAAVSFANSVRGTYGDEADATGALAVVALKGQLDRIVRAQLEMLDSEYGPSNEEGVFGRIGAFVGTDSTAATSKVVFLQRVRDTLMKNNNVNTLANEIKDSYERTVVEAVAVSTATSGITTVALTAGTSYLVSGVLLPVLAVGAFSTVASMLPVGVAVMGAIATYGTFIAVPMEIEPDLRSLEQDALQLVSMYKASLFLNRTLSDASYCTPEIRASLAQLMGPAPAVTVQLTHGNQTMSVTQSAAFNETLGQMVGMMNRSIDACNLMAKMNDPSILASFTNFIGFTAAAAAAAADNSTSQVVVGGVMPEAEPLRESGYFYSFLQWAKADPSTWSPFDAFAVQFRSMLGGFADASFMDGFGFVGGIVMGLMRFMRKRSRGVLGAGVAIGSVCMVASSLWQIAGINYLHLVVQGGMALRAEIRARAEQRAALLLEQANERERLQAAEDAIAAAAARGILLSQEAASYADITQIYEEKKAQLQERRDGVYKKNANEGKRAKAYAKINKDESVLDLAYANDVKVAIARHKQSIQQAAIIRLAVGQCDKEIDFLRLLTTDRMYQYRISDTPLLATEYARMRELGVELRMDAYIDRCILPHEMHEVMGMPEAVNMVQTMMADILTVFVETNADVKSPMYDHIQSAAEVRLESSFTQVLQTAVASQLHRRASGRDVPSHPATAAELHSQFGANVATRLGTMAEPVARSIRAAVAAMLPSDTFIRNVNGSDAHLDLNQAIADAKSAPGPIDNTECAMVIFSLMSAATA